MISKYVDHLINFDPIDSSAFSNLTLKVVISDMIGLRDHWHFSTLSPLPPPPQPPFFHQLRPCTYRLLCYKE